MSRIPSLSSLEDRQRVIVCLSVTTTAEFQHRQPHEVRVRASSPRLSNATFSSLRRGLAPPPHDRASTTGQLRKRDHVGVAQELASPHRARALRRRPLAHRRSGLGTEETGKCRQGRRESHECAGAASELHVCIQQFESGVLVHELDRRVGSDGRMRRHEDVVRCLRVPEVVYGRPKQWGCLVRRPRQTVHEAKEETVCQLRTDPRGRLGSRGVRRQRRIPRRGRRLLRSWRR